MVDNTARNIAFYKQSNKYRTNVEDTVRVATYGRVSTEHEAQLSAFSNQQQWYNNILEERPCWVWIESYYDRGISGTNAKKRPGFQRMIEDAKQGKFDLIITREVSRFARNVVDSLMYTRELQRYGVEVFFYNDNIWSFDNDGELRLTILSAMAQDEARHISERVLAGQSISRKNGTLYGNGNVLGYDLVKGQTSQENTYVINSEQAETVRLIFDMYLEGMGTKKIANRLIEMGRKKSGGSMKWDSTVVWKILNNKTYCGYICYGKSYTTSFLEHSRKEVRDSSKYEYVKADFPPIISEEVWNEVQRIKSQKVTYLDGRKHGKPKALDKWTSVLVCECGKTYKRHKWRVSKTGEESIGYRCRRQIYTRKGSVLKASGADISEDECCDVSAVGEWKLDLMCKSICNRMQLNPKDTIDILIKTIEENFVEEEIDKDIEQERLQREYGRLKSRLESLLDMRLDGKLDDVSYNNKHQQLTQRLSELEEEMNTKGECVEIAEETDVTSVIENIRSMLEQTCDLQQKHVPDDLVGMLVKKVMPTERGIFKWFIKEGDDVSPFNEDEYVLYDKFIIQYDEANAYRKQFGNYLRVRQWKDLEVEVYVRK